MLSLQFGLVKEVRECIVSRSSTVRVRIRIRVRVRVRGSGMHRDQLINRSGTDHVLIPALILNEFQVARVYPYL